MNETNPVHASAHVSRRAFLQSGVAAGALLASGVHTTFAAESKEKLNLAIIGSGGRGHANLGGVKGENIYALCDTNPLALEKAKKSHPKARVFSDWREIMQIGAVDGVVISTADHHHTPAALAAMRAGKHVYCEKPLAHTVEEARLMQSEYVKRRGKIATQMGTQIHAGANYRRVIELIRSGAIGKVSEAHVWCNRGIQALGPAKLPKQEKPEGFAWDVWLGPAEKRPYNKGYWERGNLNWNRRWEFGNGVLGDMGSHLIDLPYWALNLTRPVAVEAQGPKAHADQAPAWLEITWEHPARKGSPVLEVPCKLVWYHGKEGMARRTRRFGSTFPDITGKKWRNGIVFVGSEGQLLADYGKMQLAPQDKFQDFEAPKQTIPASKGHYREWIHAAKTGGEALCNFDYSGRLIENNLLGNAAFRLGRRIEWDGKSGKATNAPEASRYLRKVYRAGWGIA